jgi:hypothetical protein
MKGPCHSYVRVSKVKLGHRRNMAMAIFRNAKQLKSKYPDNKINTAATKLVHWDIKRLICRNLNVKL